MECNWTCILLRLLKCYILHCKFRANVWSEQNKKMHKMAYGFIKLGLQWKCRSDTTFGDKL